MNSICIATYNGERYIKAQLDSILSQIAADDEVIISDDNSEDSTLDIIRQFNDKRIKIFLNTSSRHGAIGNFQNALTKVTGENVFLSDQDDIWLPTKYKVMLKMLGDYDLVHCNSIVVDDDLSILDDSFYNVLNNGKGIIKNLIKSTYYGSHMAFKSFLLKYALPFPETEEVGHDLWLGLIGEIVGKVIFIEDKLMYYRRHSDAFCSLFEGSSRSLKQKILGRLLMIRYLLKFEFKNKRRLNNV